MTGSNLEMANKKALEDNTTVSMPFSPHVPACGRSLFNAHTRLSSPRHCIKRARGVRIISRDNIKALFAQKKKKNQIVTCAATTCSKIITVLQLFKR